MVAVDEVLALDGAVDVPPGRRGSAASQLAGTIERIETEAGRRVEAGDVLARVYTPELLTLQQDLLRASLDAALTGETLARLRKGGDAVAARRVWELEGQLNGQTAQADAARRKLLGAGLTPAEIDGLLSKREMVSTVAVRAPIAGVVAHFDKVLGQAVAAHEAVFEVRDAGRPWVRGAVAERDVSRVSLGRPVRARLVGDPDAVHTGKVARSGRAVAGSRSVPVWVELDADPGRPAVHGQWAGLTVVLGSRPPALAVPRSAVVSDGAGAFVFVRGEDGTFTRRSVETGPADDRYVTITAGLKEGEPVAVGGARELMTAAAGIH